MKTKASGLAVFDFDGTITSRDSFLEFIRFTHGSWQLWGGLLKHSYSIVFYFLGRYPNDRLKEKIFTHFYKGLSHEQMEIWGNAFANGRLLEICRPQALRCLAWHREQGHRVIILSASAAIWIGAWCEQRDLELIATRWEFENGRCTGRISGSNCWGPEKWRRLREKTNPANYTYSYGYGDQSADKHFLQHLQESYYRTFKYPL